jgi:putative flippase GtrA
MEPSATGGLRKRLLMPRLISLIASLPLAKLSRFAVVGFSLMGLHIGLGYVLVKLMHWPVMAGSILAYIGAAIIGYVSQRVITFRSHTPHSASIPRFSAMIGLGLGVSWLAAMISGRAFGLDPMIGIIAAAMLTPIANYIIMDRLVFPDQRG